MKSDEKKILLCQLLVYWVKEGLATALHSAAVSIEEIKSDQEDYAEAAKKLHLEQGSTCNYYIVNAY